MVGVKKALQAVRGNEDKKEETNQTHRYKSLLNVSKT